MAKPTKSYKTFTDSDLICENKPVTELKIVPHGTFETSKYGEIEITEEDISAMSENFDTRMGVPVDVDHENKEAVGWIKKLADKGKDGLWAAVEWTKEGSKLLKEKAYKGLSPEFALEYVDPETGKKQDATLLALSLTNFPLFQKALRQSLLADAKTDKEVILLKEKTMKKVTKVKADKKEEVTPEPTKKIKATKKEETVVKKTVKKAVKAADPVEKPPVEEPNAKKAVEKIEKVEAVKASEMKAVEERAEKAEMELSKMKVEKEVTDSLLFNERGGKFAPKVKDDLVAFKMSLSKTQSELFEKILAGIKDVKVFKEEGSDTKETLAPQERLDKLVDKTVKDEGMAYDAALRKVNRDNPDLVEEIYKE